MWKIFGRLFSGTCEVPQKNSNLFTDDFGKFPPLREMNPLLGGDFEGSICWDSTLASKGLF